eukprot:2799253-Pleurochrysis_carterae.AAC.1
MESEKQAQTQQAAAAARNGLPQQHTAEAFQPPAESKPLTSSSYGRRLRLERAWVEKGASEVQARPPD